MSKAFTRESDDLPEVPVVARQRSPLPPGAKNYLTPDGARRLREELERLVQVERPRQAASPDHPEAKRQLQELDQRIYYLQQSLQSAVVVAPPIVPEAGIRFGASVTVRDRSGGESRYRIVGVDETDLDRGWVLNIDTKRGSPGHCRILVWCYEVFVIVLSPALALPYTSHIIVRLPGSPPPWRSSRCG